MAQYVDPFAYHKPNDEEVQRIEKLRKAYYELFCQVSRCTKPGSVSGRYAEKAVEALEESAMWATKSIVFESNNE